MGPVEAQLTYLRESVAKCVGYTLTGNADEDDAQLVDRLGEMADEVERLKDLAIHYKRRCGIGCGDSI